MLGMSLGLRPMLVPGQGGGAISPVNTVLPAISGTAVQGQTLSVSLGAWTGTAPISYACQWQRAEIDIAGATSADYVLQAADVGAAVCVVVTATNAAGSITANSAVTVAVVALGPSLPALPVTPHARWHPAFSTVAESGGRVVSASDLMGISDATEGGAGIGPKAMTDAMGNKFWRFEGEAFLTIANSLATIRASSAVFMVGRFHRIGGKCPVFSLGNQASATKAEMLSAQVVAKSAPLLRSFGNYPRDATLPNANRTVAGSQMQVVGCASRGAGGGGTSIWLNKDRLDNGRNDTGSQTGAEIGRNAATPGSSGNWGTFDLYDIAVYTQALSNAEGLAIVTALQAAYAIPDVTAQLILEGDSITQGTGLVTSGLACSMILTEPGTTHIPAHWRVVNVGTSGNQVADMVLRRDAPAGWPVLALPGGPAANVVAFEIGRNDWVAGGLSASQHYANVVAYLTGVTGILQRGWAVRAMANIAGPASLNDVYAYPYRAMLRDPQFLADTLSGLGQAFEGRVSVVSTDLIEHAGETRFFDGADAGNMTYYAGDSTHPAILGTEIRMTGGTTPHYGVAYGL